MSYHVKDDDLYRRLRQATEYLRQKELAQLERIKTREELLKTFALLTCGFIIGYIIAWLYCIV